MALVIEEKKFQHILRILNTNVNGRDKVPFALSRIRGIGKRFAFLICKKAEINTKMRAGEMTEEELELVRNIIANPRHYGIPDWFLNRQKDTKTGEYSQVTVNGLDTKLREDFERMKRIRLHRGLRHYWGLRVRGQHTKSTGRRGRTVGILKKK